jgi:hypothetical protein
VTADAVAPDKKGVLRRTLMVNLKPAAELRAGSGARDLAGAHGLRCCGLGVKPWPFPKDGTDCA